MFCGQDQFIFKCKLFCPSSKLNWSKLKIVLQHIYLDKIWGNSSWMKCILLAIAQLWAQNMYGFNRVKFISLAKFSINFSNIYDSLTWHIAWVYLSNTFFIFVLQNYFGKGKTTSTNVVNIYHSFHKILIGNSAENIL